MIDKKTVLVISAHPDDETLGAGGTIAKLVKKGYSIYSIIACSENMLNQMQSSENLKNCAKRAAKILGIKKTYFLGFSDQKLDTMPVIQLTKAIEAIVSEIQPEIVFIQHGGDLNFDHKRLFDAGLVAIRPTNKFIEKVYAFETLSSTEWAFPQTFSPDTWIDISETLEKKIDAMKEYSTELKTYPHPRSIESIKHLAANCGTTILVDFAEKFMTIWNIER